MCPGVILIFFFFFLFDSDLASSSFPIDSYRFWSYLLACLVALPYYALKFFSQSVSPTILLLLLFLISRPLHEKSLLHFSFTGERKREMSETTKRRKIPSSFRSSFLLRTFWPYTFLTLLMSCIYQNMHIDRAATAYSSRKWR